MRGDGDATVERVRFSVPAGRLYLFDPDQDSRTADPLVIFSSPSA